MAFTPYPNTDPQEENPSVVASADGETWVEPAGISNPLAPSPSGSGYNSDTDLVIEGGTAYLFWRAYDDGPENERIKLITSTDGVTWTSPVELITTTPAEQRLASPAVVFDGTTWHMWGVDIVPSPNVVKHYTASAPDGPWTYDQIVSGLSYPYGREAWHLDVIRDAAGVFWMLLNDCTLDTSGGSGNLLLARSEDGLTWTMRGEVIDGLAGKWDSAIYRSTGQFKADGSMDLWYSGRSSTWFIGRSTIPASDFA